MNGVARPPPCHTCSPGGDSVQACDPGERWPGLYEVPMWRLDQLYSGPQPYTMDYGYSYECECMEDTHSVFDILRANFDASYGGGGSGSASNGSSSGTRAPFPLFIHSPWLGEQDNLEQLEDFIGEWVGWIGGVRGCLGPFGEGSSLA